MMILLMIGNWLDGAFEQIIYFLWIPRDNGQWGRLNSWQKCHPCHVDRASVWYNWSSISSITLIRHPPIYVQLLYFLCSGSLGSVQDKGPENLKVLTWWCPTTSIFLINLTLISLLFQTSWSELFPMIHRRATGNNQWMLRINVLSPLLCCWQIIKIVVQHLGIIFNEAYIVDIWDFNSSYVGKQ